MSKSVLTLSANVYCKMGQLLTEKEEKKSKMTDRSLQSVAEKS